MPASFALRTLHRAAVLSVPLAIAALPGLAAAGTLPSPYVSRALDAVLIPVNADTIAAFGLAADETGVLILATEPSGVADAAGFSPGDVISSVQGKTITDPILLDEIVYYWINKGTYDFGFDGWRAGVAHTVSTVVTLEAWETVIDVTTIATWTAYSSESFIYSEYYSEYSEEITASYESSETMIEETATSEEFAADTEDSSSDDAAMDDSSDNSEADPADEGGDGSDMSDGSDSSDDDAGDSGGDDGGDSGADDTTGSDE